MPGNTLEVQIVEGGSAKAATATVVQSRDPSLEVVGELNDSGIGADRVARDTYFRALVPAFPPGEYRVIVTMTDNAGNADSDTLDLVRKNM